jgi:hypothetical protein
MDVNYISYKTMKRKSSLYRSSMVANGPRLFRENLSTRNTVESR